MTEFNIIIDNILDIYNWNNIYCPKCGEKRKYSNTKVYYDAQISEKKKNTMIFYCKNHIGFLYFTIEPFFVNELLTSCRVMIFHDESKVKNAKFLYCCFCGERRSHYKSKVFIITKMSDNRSKIRMSICMNHTPYPIHTQLEEYVVRDSMKTMILFVRYNKKPRVEQKLNYSIK